MSMARIVVVEDEPAIRRGVGDALRVSGYEVVEAADGQKGLEEAVRLKVDLVLLDLLLPRRDGLAVLAEIRKLRPTLQVIILTVRGAEVDRPGARLGRAVIDFAPPARRGCMLPARVAGQRRLRDSSASTTQRQIYAARSARVSKNSLLGPCAAGVATIPKWRAKRQARQ